MKKYILMGRKSSSIRLNVKDEAEITEKLNVLKTEGADLADYIVTEIDTERQPPIQRTAAEWLDSKNPKEADVAETAGKNRSSRAMQLIGSWRSRLADFFWRR